MASQVMVTGLSPYRAYQVAEAIEDRLHEQGCVSVTSDELSRVAFTVIGEIAGGATRRTSCGGARWSCSTCRS